MGTFQAWVFLGVSPSIPKGTLRLLQDTDASPQELNWVRVTWLDVSLPGSFDLVAKAILVGVQPSPIKPEAAAVGKPPVV